MKKPATGDFYLFLTCEILESLYWKLYSRSTNHIEKIYLAISKFNRLKQEFRTVLLACTGSCSNAPKQGWITSGITKKTVARQKRKRNIDVRTTFRPRPLKGPKSFLGWLSDSKQLWDQLRFDMRVKRQINKRRNQL